MDIDMECRWMFLNLLSGWKRHRASLHENIGENKECNGNKGWINNLKKFKFLVVVSN